MNTPTTNLAELRRQMDLVSSRGEFIAYVKALAAAKGGDVGSAAAIARSHRASDRVVALLEKAAVVGGGTPSTNWAGDLRQAYALLASNFLDSLTDDSAFIRLLNDAILTRIPMKTRVALVSAGATGWVRGEGKPTPLSRLQIEGNELAPAFASALLVVTRELANAGGSAAMALFSRELRVAVGSAIDAEFIDRITAGTATLSAAATASPRHDLRTLLAAVNTTGQPHRLAWLLAVDTANTASTVGSDDNAALLFPAMTPQGGELVGLPALVSPSMPSGQLMLLDGRGIVGDADNVEVSISDQTDIEMNDAPTSDLFAPTHASLNSMFQQNSLAIKADVAFGLERLRTGAVAILTGAAAAWDPA